MGQTTLSFPSSPLVSAPWLAEHLAHPALRILDVRGRVLPPTAPSPRYQPKPEDYAAGHIPGAVFVDWTRDIVDLDDPIPAQIAPPAKFAETMSARGVGDEARVVVYDDYSHMFAGRLHWALRYYGHDEVRILEGGIHAWNRAGFALSTDAPTPPRARFTPRPRGELRRTADEVARAVAAGALLIDARSSAQFAGSASAAKRFGHIPGARNVPYPSLLEDSAGAFLAPERLRQVFADAGVDIDDKAASAREIIVYCNGGISATVPMAALALLGVTGVALYDGSWNEWGNDAARPVETGPAC